MLKNLKIKNYVLINQLDVDFTDGLSIITGETGAGKSILLGALGLVLGERSDSKALADKSKKCVIETTFDISQYALADFFKQHDLDFENLTILRREINPEGKSRAFINDTPVNLSVLKELSLLLVDVHSQHQTLNLNNSLFQLFVVDTFAEHKELLNDYRSKYEDFKKSQNHLTELIAREERGKAESDFVQFQWEELEAAQLIEGEKNLLEQELQLLSNTETIVVSLGHLYSFLSEGENSTLYSISQATTTLNQVARFHASLHELLNRMQSCKEEIKDIASEINHLQDRFNHNPQRIEIVNDRLTVYNRLEQKHRVANGDDLLEIKNNLSEKLLAFSSLADEIEKAQKKVIDLKEYLESLATRLTANRKKAAIRLKKQMKQLLDRVVLPDANFEIDIVPLAELNASGKDQIAFRFSANKGIAPQEIIKVASGGELSRLMLCIKTAMANLVALPTIIFDEIDTGISGEVAFKVGAMIEQLAANIQVIAITHLPQMASKGKTHYNVYKKEEKGISQSSIKVLNEQERVVEIAKMLSGVDITDASIENAKDLLLK
jgi:DNA repair protein RecN (Recombination protein N)